ncbi:hypothetical protein [Sphingomonas sp. KR3-1]
MLEFIFDWVVDLLPFRVWLILMIPVFLLLAWIVLAHYWPGTFGL